MALTAKQEAFIQEYLIDLNATQAAIRAGYSEKTAEVIGYENLNKPQIKCEISKRMQERASRTQITADRVLKEYAKIAFADIKNFLSYRTEKVHVGNDEEGNPLFGYKQIIEMVPSDDVDGTMVGEVSINEKGVFSFKLHDKKDALDKLSRHLGLFNDKLKIDAEVGVKIVDDIDD